MGIAKKSSAISLRHLFIPVPVSLRFLNFIDAVVSLSNFSLLISIKIHTSLFLWVIVFYAIISPLIWCSLFHSVCRSGYSWDPKQRCSLPAAELNWSEYMEISNFCLQWATEVRVGSSVHMQTQTDNEHEERRRAQITQLSEGQHPTERPLLYALESWPNPERYRPACKVANECRPQPVTNRCSHKLPTIKHRHNRPRWALAVLGGWCPRDYYGRYLQLDPFKFRCVRTEPKKG